MGVTDLLARYAARRAHAMIVEVPGQWKLRALVERRLTEFGWRTSTSTADADVLVVCGRPGPELAGAVDCIWDQLPGPRVRLGIDDAEMIDSALNRALAELAESQRHRIDARERPQAPGATGDRADACHESDGGHHGQHGQHEGHGGMDMAPAGIPLADGGDDRDGLEMDVLHVCVGPVLAYWPAGLVMRCALQGDVLAGAEVWLVDRDEYPAREVDNARCDAAARQCDHVVSLLALAGWPRAATTARRARDLLSDGHTSQTRPVLDSLYRMLSGSRVLRWSLRGLARLTAEDVDRMRLPAALVGDTYDRLLTRVDRARHGLSNPLFTTPIQLGPADLGVLPDLVAGLDLATARLVVASLGIETATVNDSSRRG